MSAIPDTVADSDARMRSAAVPLAHRLRNWHGIAGIVSALSLLVLVASGIALNHTQELGLAESEITAPPVTAWYGLRPQSPESGFRVGESWLLASGGKWRLGATDLGDRHPVPVGAVVFGAWHCVASADTLFLFQPDGRIVDKIGRDGLPGVPIQALGGMADAIVIRLASGVYRSTDGVEWSPTSAEGVRWSAAEALPESVRTAARSVFVPGVQTERLIRDIHSGRILGRFGSYLVDTVALLLLLLSCTGAWMYVRSQRRRAAMRRGDL